MTRVNADNLFGLSQFIVDPIGGKGSFTTIQSAMDAANAGGGGVIYIKGEGLTYSENLTFYDNIQLIGVNADGRLPIVTIAGNHIVGDGMTVSASNIFFTAGGAAQIFQMSPTANPTILAIKNCDLLNNTGVAVHSSPAGAGSSIFLGEGLQVNTSSHCFQSTGGGAGTDWNLKLGDYNSSGTGRFFDLGGSDRAFVDGITGDFGGEAFFMNGGGETVECSISRISCNLFAFAAPLGGTITASNDVISCLDPSGFYVSGSPNFNYSGITLVGTAKDLNVTVGDFPATWKPFATAGTSVTAVRGTAGFDNTNFTMVDGLVSALNPVLTAQVTLTSAQVKALRATPVEVIPAVGAGKTPLLIEARLKLNYGGTNPFTNPQNLNFKYNNAAGDVPMEGILGTGWIDQSANIYQDAIVPSGTKIYADTMVENASVVIQNVGGSEITGNAANDNTVVVTVIYRILTQ